MEKENKAINKILEFIYFAGIFLILYWVFVLLLNNLVYNNQAKMEWLMEWKGCGALPWTCAYYLAPVISFITAAVASGVIQAFYRAKRFLWARSVIFIAVFWFIDYIVLSNQSSLWDFYPTREYEFTAPSLAILCTILIIRRMIDRSEIITRVKPYFYV